MPEPPSRNEDRRARLPRARDRDPELASLASVMAVGTFHTGTLTDTTTLRKRCARARALQATHKSAGIGVLDYDVVANQDSGRPKFALLGVPRTGGDGRGPGLLPSGRSRSRRRCRGRGSRSVDPAPFQKRIPHPSRGYGRGGGFRDHVSDGLQWCRGRCDRAPRASRQMSPSAGSAKNGEASSSRLSDALRPLSHPLDVQ